MARLRPVSPKKSSENINLLPLEHSKNTFRLPQTTGTSSEPPIEIDVSVNPRLQVTVRVTILDTNKLRIHVDITEKDEQTDDDVQYPDLSASLAEIQSSAESGRAQPPLKRAAMSIPRVQTLPQLMNIISPLRPSSIIRPQVSAVAQKPEPLSLVPIIATSKGATSQASPSSKVTRRVRFSSPLLITADPPIRAPSTRETIDERLRRAELKRLEMSQLRSAVAKRKAELRMKAAKEKRWKIQYVEQILAQTMSRTQKNDKPGAGKVISGPGTKLDGKQPASAEKRVIQTQSGAKKRRSLEEALKIVRQELFLRSKAGAGNKSPFKPHPTQMSPTKAQPNGGSLEKKRKDRDSDSIDYDDDDVHAIKQRGKRRRSIV